MAQERNSIGVRVRPNADQFITDLRKQMAAKKLTFYVDIGANTKKATVDVQAWAKTQLKAIPAAISVGANMSQATTDVREWREVQRKIKTNIPIGADLSAATRDVKVWREAIGRPLEIKIRSDVGGLRSIEAARKSIKRDLDQLSLFDVEPTVKPKTAAAEAEVKEFTKRASKDPVEKKLDLDLKEARLRLLGLKSEALASKMVVKVDVETSKFDAFQKRLKQLTFGSGSRKGGPLSFNIPGPLGTISAPGGLAGIVALGAATPAAVVAVASLSKALIDLAGAAALVPGAIAAVGASVATLAVGTQGVGEAFSAMFDLWKEGSDAQQSQVKGLVTAHNSYKTALANEATAQRNVSQARENALNDLRNLHNELRRGSLNEAQAILNVQKSADTLAKGGFQTQTDYTQALLDQANAQADLVDVRERNAQLQQKGNEENAKGVEGSDQVVAALQAQTQAADATAAALQSISDTSAAGATSKFSDALAQLSPNARDFVEQVNGSKGALHGFKNELQDIIFQGSGAGFKNFFANLEPIIRPGMKEIAEGLNKNLLQVFDSLSSPGGKSIIERILGGTAESQKALTGLIDPLIRGVGTLAAAGAEKLPALIDLFTRLADRFANFAEGADKSGALDAFFDRGIKALEQLVDIGVNLFKIINDLGKSFGGDLLQSLVNVTDRLHNFLASDAGQERLKKWIKEAGELWDDWKPALEQLPELISRLSSVATQALNVLSPILSGILTALEKAPILVEAFAAVWFGNKMLGALSTVAKLGKGVADIVGNLAKIPKAIGNLPTVGPGGAPGAPIGTAAGGAVAAIGGAAIAGAATAGVGSALINVGTQAAQAQPGQISIDDLNAKLPSNAPPIAGFNAKKSQQFAIQYLADQGDPAAKWIMAAAGAQAPAAPGTLGAGWILADPASEVEVAKRYLYAMTHDSGPNFVAPAPGSYESGGFTNWPQKMGKMAMLHGKEYIQPADTVSHYGIGAMKAVHEKRVPKGMLQSFDGGGYFDPASGQWVPEGAAPSQHGVTAAAVDPGMPGAGGAPGGIIPTIVGGATGIAQSFAGQAIGAIQSGGGLGPAPGPGGVPGVGTGPLPGPALDIPGLPATPGPEVSGPAMNFNLFGINIPLGNAPVNQGWGNAGPPPGLGGGPGINGQAPFDIRNFGIGPGPAGSGPADWAQEVGKVGGEFLSGTASALAEGFLGGLGLSGLGQYGSAAGQLGQHFIPSGSSSAQGAGSADANAAALADIGQYYSTPANPAFPGLPPGVASAAPTGNSKGLQVNTARGKGLIQANFPWATNIGGVRPDALKWHPSGLALDVMIPGAGGLNDPTPPAGKAEGDQLYAWLMAHKAELGIDYILWQQKDHFNHLHVNFAASGYAAGDTPTLPTPSAPAVGPGSRPTGTPPPSPPPTSHEAQPSPPKTSRFDPVPLPIDSLPKLTRDQGGWLPTGHSLVSNYTGKPELVLSPAASASFLEGGFNFIKPPPPTPGPIPPAPPLPRGPTAKTLNPPPSAPQAPSGPAATGPPAVGPPSEKPGKPGDIAPPSQPTVPASPAPPAAPGQAPASPGVTPATVAPGIDPSDKGMHVHPALQKGIDSGAKALGNAAATAIGIAGSLGSFGAGGGAAGGIGSLAAGLIEQGGKIVKNIVNVPSSFLVGSITGGTTQNPYGSTQRSTNPSGGTFVDQSHHGDVYTQNLDDYFHRMDVRDAQKAQGILGRFA